MSREQVFEALQSVFDDVFQEPVKVTPDLSANDVDEWDSITHINVVIAIEQRLGIRFRVGEVEATRNVGDFADLIQHRLAETAR
jgi:acyl carrier protein